MGDDEIENEIETEIDACTPWVDRLDVVALACAGALLVLLVGTVLSAVTLDISGPGSGSRYSRLQFATQLGNLAFGGVVLAAATAAAVRQWLTADSSEGHRRGEIVDLVVASTAVVYGLAAAVGFVNELWMPGDFGRNGFMFAQAGLRLSAVLVAAGALWLVGTTTNPFAARVDDDEPDDDPEPVEPYLSR